MGVDSVSEIEKETLVSFFKKRLHSFSLEGKELKKEKNALSKKYERLATEGRIL